MTERDVVVNVFERFWFTTTFLSGCLAQQLLTSLSTLWHHPYHYVCRQRGVSSKLDWVLATRPYCCQGSCKSKTKDIFRMMRSKCFITRRWVG